MKTNQINLSAIEELLAQVIKAQQEQGETQQQKVVVTNDPITSITEARLRVERLDNLGIGVKFKTLWNDRTAVALGFSKEHIRYVSGLRAWNRSIEVDPKYQAAAIKTAIELEDQYNVHGIIYRERTITKEQAKEFNMVSVPKLNKSDFRAWYARRSQEFEMMGGHFFWALNGSLSEKYNERVYGSEYYGINLREFCLSEKESLDKIDTYAEERKQKIRRYMVIVARQCLVL